MGQTTLFGTLWRVRAKGKYETTDGFERSFDITVFQVAESAPEAIGLTARVIGNVIGSMAESGGWSYDCKQVNDRFIIFKGDN